MNIVLIVVFLAGYGSRPTVEFHDFYKLERCQIAAKTIRDAYRASDYERSLIRVECVEK
jgi:hypothetical protein